MNLLKKSIEKLNPGSFFKMNAIFFIGSLVVSFLNYLYYPILGRILPIEYFGEVQVTISLYTQITILFSVLSLITVNIVSNTDKEDSENIIAEFQKLSLFISIILLIVFVLIAPILQTAFKFESAIPFVLIAFIVISNIPVVFKTAFLRGKADFVGTSIGGIVTSTFKILMSLVFVYLGFKTSGAIGGLIVANIINFIYISYRVKKHSYKKVRSNKHLPDFKLIKPQLPYAALVLITSLTISLYSSIDISIVKYLFPTDVAGKYAGISVISNIVLFITGSFAVVILSAVKRNAKANENNKILFKSFILTLIAGGGVALTFILFPNQIVGILFGNRYSEFSFLLPYLSIAMLLISLSSLITNFHIALRNYFVSVFIILSVTITFILLLNNNSSLQSIVQSLLTGSIILFVLLFGWTLFKILNVKKIN